MYHLIHFIIMTYRHLYNSKFSIPIHLGEGVVVYIWIINVHACLIQTHWHSYHTFLYLLSPPIMILTIKCQISFKLKIGIQLQIYIIGISFDIHIVLNYFHSLIYSQYKEEELLWATTHHLHDLQTSSLLTYSILTGADFFFLCPLPLPGNKNSFKRLSKWEFRLKSTIKDIRPK